MSFKKQLRAVLFAGIGATAMMTAGPAQAGNDWLSGIVDHAKDALSGQVQQGGDNMMDKASCKLQGGVMVQGRYDSRNTRNGGNARASGSNANKCLFPGTVEYNNYQVKLQQAQARQDAIDLKLERERLKNDKMRTENAILSGSGQHAGTNNTNNININQGSGQQPQSTGGFNITSSRDGGASNSVMSATEIAALNIAACERTRAKDCKAEHQGIGNQVAKVGNMQLTAKYNDASIFYREKISRNNSAQNEQNQTRTLINKLNN